MSETERLSRKFAKGMIADFVEDKPEKFVNLLTCAYFDRLVRVLTQHIDQQIFEGSAWNQFFDLSLLVKSKTGKGTFEQIFEDIKNLSDSCLGGNKIVTETERKQISNVVAQLVPAP